jgi:methanethiol S-methyltransferase
LSFAFIGGGFVLISAGWKLLFDAQHRHELASTGVYARIRHPQYLGFILVMFGFLLQWPTLLTLAMFPVLVFMYVRLAHSEERDAIREFGDRYRAYMAEVPAFIPRVGYFTGRPKRGHAGHG